MVDICVVYKSRLQVTQADVIRPSVNAVYFQDIYTHIILFSKRLEDSVNISRMHGFASHFNTLLY